MAKAEGMQRASAEWVRCLTAAACCWLAAWTFWVAWWRPLDGGGGEWVVLGVGMLVLEFISIHSSTLIGELAAAGAAARRLCWLLLGVYAIFAAGILMAFSSLEMLWLVLALMATRLFDVLRPGTGRERAYGRRRSMVSGMLFLILAFATVFLPVPPGGITPDLLEAVWPDRGEGVWEAEPQRALAMGMLYFALLGLVELRPPASFWLGE